MSYTSFIYEPAEGTREYRLREILMDGVLPIVSETYLLHMHTPKNDLPVHPKIRKIIRFEELQEDITDIIFRGCRKDAEIFAQRIYDDTNEPVGIARCQNVRVLYETYRRARVARSYAEREGLAFEMHRKG